MTGQPLFATAVAYEQFMGRWSRRLAVPFLEFARVESARRILDVGCGTGALAMAAAAAYPQADVIGIDPSDAYLQRARAGDISERVRFAPGDASAIDLPAASIDLTVSLLVLNFVPVPAEAVAEMIRVTRPGGVVAAAVWDYGGDMEMLRLFWSHVVALLPSLAPRDERHMPLCRPGELASLWQSAGLVGAAEESLTIDLPFRSFDDFWTPFLGGQGPAGAVAASLPLEVLESLAARLAETVTARYGTGPFTLRARAWAVQGRVPETSRVGT